MGYEDYEKASRYYVLSEGIGDIVLAKLKAVSVWSEHISVGNRKGAPSKLMHTAGTMWVENT